MSADTTIADIGCGFGWLSMAIAAFTPARVIAVEMDRKRLDAAAAIAALLGLNDRIIWREGSVVKIPLADREADVTFCVEVLEHIQRDARAFAELERVTGKYLVITTPNAAFPIIMHDTCLPLSHWLPMPARNLYATICGRRETQFGNRFWAPWDIPRYLPNFKRVSHFLHFNSVDDYFDLYPYYLPYGRGSWRSAPSRKLRLYYNLAGSFGGVSQYFLQSLAGTFERRA